MTFTIFGLTGYGYGLAAGLSALVYLGAAVLLQRRRGIAAEALLFYGVLGLVLGLVCSRLVFCAVNAAYFLQTIAQPGRMLAFWDGGFSMSGLLIGLVLAVLLTAKRHALPFAALLDAATLPMGLLLCGLRLAEGFTQTLGIGRQIDVSAAAGSLPFLFVTETLGTMQLHRLAVYRYEAVFALLLFLFFLWFIHQSKTRKSGDIALLFFALYGAGQVLFESMRDDGHMVMGFIRVQQVLGLLSVLLVLGVLCKRYGKRHQARDAVTAAWMMLPIAAFVLVLMVAPINHVLDLSGHMALGTGVLGVLGLYLAFFLRRRGANRRLIVTWLAALLTVAACVLLEFSMDGSASILRDYALLALCCAILFLCPYTLYRSLRRQEADAP